MTRHVLGLSITSLLFYSLASAGEFHRIGQLPAMSVDSTLYVEDWDGDGDLELVHSDYAWQYRLSHASQDLRLLQVYEAHHGQWALRHAFICRPATTSDTESRPEWQFKPAETWPELNGRETDRVEGDFNEDGIPDVLVAELESPGGNNFVLSLKQDEITLFTDVLYSVEHSVPLFQTFQVVDIDTDGATEVFAWIRGIQSNPEAVIFGTPSSQWKAPSPLNTPLGLGNAMIYLNGFRAAVPEGLPPVTATVQLVSSTRPPKDEDGFAPATDRFRVELSAREGGGITDLAPWRDYFMRWGIGYVRDSETDWDGVQQVREMRATPREDNAFEFETEYPTDVGWLFNGTYKLWMECPYVERNSNPFGWFGTMYTPEIDVAIAQWPAEDELAKVAE